MAVYSIYLQIDQTGLFLTCLTNKNSRFASAARLEIMLMGCFICFRSKSTVTRKGNEDAGKYKDQMCTKVQVGRPMLRWPVHV